MDGKNLGTLRFWKAKPPMPDVKIVGVFSGWVFLVPIGSMYGIYTYVWLIFMVNVAKYSMHGYYGVGTFVRKKTAEKRPQPGERDFFGKDDETSIYSKDRDLAKLAILRTRPLLCRFKPLQGQMILSWFSGLKYLPLLSKRFMREPQSGDSRWDAFGECKGKTPNCSILFSPKIPCRPGVYMVWFLLFPCVFGFGMGKGSWSSRSRWWFQGFFWMFFLPQQYLSGNMIQYFDLRIFFDRVAQPPTPVYY